MTNAEKFRNVFGLYATELWSMPEKEFLEWLNAEIQPDRKRGEWIELTNTSHTYVCSVCGRMLVNISEGKNNVARSYPFCHCGADMRGESE